MDIDIDLQTSFKPEEIFNQGVRAMVIREEEATPHACGFYLQNMPKDPFTGLAAIPYDKAEDVGYYKIDFLHLSVYDYFDSKEQIDELLKLEPDWTLLNKKENVEKLFQLSRHFDILQKIKPKSIEDLADANALIRPGKKELLNIYITNKELARRMLYARNEDGGYSFKRSHAIAYALVIVLQLHLIAIGMI